MGEHTKVTNIIKSVGFSALEGFTSIMSVYVLVKIIIHKLKYSLRFAEKNNSLVCMIWLS